MLNNQSLLTVDAAEKVWKATAYVRLSKEDGDKEESDSITNQKALITEYVKSRSGIRICSERIDDGFSGVDFERPAFIEMMNDIKSGRIDCIVVKDLSRFGRNWIETGRYLEHIFPYLGVRFIAINDNLDSLQHRVQNDNITIPFKNLINDAYCRDISIKIKSQLETKCKKGDFIGSFATYGYIKDEKNHNRLVIDECAAVVVRDVFKWKLDGMSQQGIANRLNDMGVPSPLEYKRQQGLDYSTGFKVNPRAVWSAVAISRILKNEIYIGVLEQGKSAHISYKVKNRVRKSKEEWIRVENAHESIISTDEFETVQQLLKQDVRIAPSEEAVYLFSGLIKCADCGQNMLRKTVPSSCKKYVYYVCAASKSSKVCTSHSISEPTLEQSVLHIVKTHIENIIELERVLQFIDTLPLKQLDVQKLDKQIQAKKEEMAKYLIRKTKLYEDYSDGVVDHDEYLRLKATFNERYNNAEEAVFKLSRDIEDIINNRTDKHRWIDCFKEFQSIESLSRKIIVKLVDRILIHEKSKIDIRFKYQHSFERASSFIEAVSQIFVAPNNEIMKGASHGAEK